MANTEICVQSTKDYDSIKNIAGNRVPNPRNIEFIKNSMHKKQLIVPAIVNEKMEIIDGQHRLQACRELDLPFYYIQIDGYRLEDVQTINANMKNWALEDFLDSFVSLYQLGNSSYSDYALIKTYIKDTNLPLATALAISDLSKGTGELREDFKHGKFKFLKYDVCMEYAQALKDFEIYDPKKWNTAIFAKAYAPFYNSEKINHARLLKNIPRRLQQFQNAVGAKVIADTIINIYNLGINKREELSVQEINKEWYEKLDKKLERDKKEKAKG